MNLVMKSVFNLPNILTQSHSHTWAGFHYPQKTPSSHKSRQQPSDCGIPRVRYAFQQLWACLLVMRELWGHSQAGGEVLMLSS